MGIPGYASILYIFTLCLWVPFFSILTELLLINILKFFGAKKIKEHLWLSYFPLL